MRRSSNVFANLDTTILVVTIFLAIFGWINIYAASYNADFPSIFDSSQEYGKQFIWLIVASVIFGVVLLLDTELFLRLSWVYYALGMLLLVLVLIFGREVNGAKSWFGYGGFGLQPSEFAKIATIFALSKIISENPVSTWKELALSIIIIAMPCALIMLQPDTGTVLVFSSFLLLLYRFGYVGNIILGGILAIILAILSLIIQASSFTIPFTEIGLQGKYVLVIIIFSLATAAFFISRSLVLKRYRKTIGIWIIGTSIISSVFVLGVNYAVNEVLSDHQTTRVNILLGLEEDPQGAGYNVKQSKTSIGSGGFLGKGFLNGTLTKFKYVPMQSTDFIFCTVGEEWGFIGTALVVIAFAVLIFRLVFIAERQRSLYSKVFIYAVAVIFFLHLFINVGMTIGLAPVIGIPLPFFSYGGSSLLSFILMIAISLRLDAERLNVLR